MTTTIDFEPFDFHGELSIHDFKLFLKYARENHVSDILVQTGDTVWVEQFGRQRKASHSTVKQGHLDVLIASLWGGDVLANIQGGKGDDRSLEVRGEEYGLERGEVIRCRCRFDQGRIGEREVGTAITMRLIPSDKPDLSKMGIEEDLLPELFPIMGLGLICGPTGSGKSTLMAGMYAHSGKHFPDRKVITFENPIEFVLGGENWLGPLPCQGELGRDIASFDEGIRGGMRRAPKIIGIGEIRDAPTAESAIQAAITGHMCMATLHVESVAEATNRMVQFFPHENHEAAANQLMSALRYVIVQRLLPTTDGKRKPIREYMVFDRDLRHEMQLMHFKEWSGFIREHLAKRNARLDDKAWSLYEAGEITDQTFIELSGYKAFRTRKEAQA